MKKVVWMFSGQGSQYYGMGRDLYEADDLFREAMNQCDEHFRRFTNESLFNIIYPPGKRDRFADFDDILHTHPGLFCLQYSLAQSLLRRQMKPDLLLGYSLGEIIAAAVAEALPFDTILEAVIDQARLLKASVGPGAMLAILESPAIRDPDDPLYAKTWVAARNFRNHFVLAGVPEAIDRIQNHLKSQGISTQRLPVPIAFHSPLMDVVEQAFKQRIGRRGMKDLSYPLVSSSHVDKLTRLTPDFFWEVIRRPVRFEETVAWLEAQGDCIYVDLGPSGTLATFLKYGLRAGASSTIHSIITPFNRAGENLRQLGSVLNERR